MVSIVQDESDEERARAEGKFSEADKAAASEHVEHRDDMPEDAFLEPAARKYPVKEKRDGEWKYDRDLLLAAAREARMHGHDELARRADAIRDREFKGAQDSFALDRESVRKSDANGYLHVAASNISKAGVNPYYGREIPDFESLGLQPDKVYHLLRPADELEKAAATFNGMPLMMVHKPQDARGFAREVVVGSLGNDAEFSDPYLRNSLTVWDAQAIAGIETGDCKEISCGYRYEPVMEPGEYQGVRFDGRMTNLKGNHVALVPDGRAGPSCVVGDRNISIITKELNAMAKAPLSRKAALVKGVLSHALAPKMAQDAKLDFGKILNGVTAKNFSAEKKNIFSRIQAETKGKLAQDATLDDVLPLLDAVDNDDDETVDDKPATAVVGDDDLLESIKSKLTPEEHAKLCEMVKGAAPAVVGDEDDDDDEKVTKQAMDAAIKAAEDRAAKAAESAVITRMNAVREAENEVRPYIGSISVAQDSAEAVYRMALDALKVEHKDIKEAAALRAVLKAQTVPGARQHTPRIAQDAAAADAYAKRFPNASRLSGR